MELALIKPLNIDVPLPDHLDDPSLSFELSGSAAVLLGRNGAGKSSILRAIHGVESAEGWRTHLIEPERASDTSYDANTAQNDRTWRENQSRAANVDTQYRRRVLARLGRFLTHLGANPERTSEGPKSFLEELLSACLLGLEIKVVGEPPYLNVTDRLTGRSRVNGTKIPSLSSGENEALTILIDVFVEMWLGAGGDDHELVLVLVDEPDAHFHPDLQLRFARSLGEIVRFTHGRLIVTSQNPAFATAMGLAMEDELLVGFVGSGGSLRVKPYDVRLERLGGLFGGTAIAAALGLGVPLIVEGVDDEAIWSGLSRRANFPGDLIVIPAGGKGEVKQYRKSLSTLLAASSEWRDGDQPLAIALLDGDASAGIDLNAPVAQVKFACREAENLLFADETLAVIGLDRSGLSEKLVELSDDYPELSSLTRPDEIDFKDGDLKRLAHTLAPVLDSDGRTWWQIVQEALAASGRPEGTLAEYLGEAVVDAIWG